MLGLLLTCFVVGLIVVMLFTEEGRGCIGGILALGFGLLVITAIGAAAIGGLIWLLTSFN